MTDIPDINIPEIPQINVNSYISTPLPVLNVPLPNIDLLGLCKDPQRCFSKKYTDNRR